MDVNVKLIIYMFEPQAYEPIWKQMDLNLNARWVKGISRISPGTLTESKNCYLSYVNLLAARAPGTICECPLSDWACITL